MNVTFAVIPMIIALTIRPVLLVTAAALTVVVVILAIALVFLHRRGVSWKHISIIIGSVVVAALLLPLLSMLGVPTQDIGALAIGFGLLSIGIGIARRQRFQGGRRRNGHPQK